MVDIRHHDKLITQMAQTVPNSAANCCRVLLAGAVLLLVGCVSQPAVPVPAQCNPICFLPCTSDGDPGVRWEADPNDPAAWDALGEEVIPALTGVANTCELRRKACDQCLRRLDDAGAIEL